MAAESSTRSAPRRPESPLIEGWHRVGPHRYCVQADVLHWRFVGEVTLEHVQQSQSAIRQIYERYGYCLTLIDANGDARMTPAARHYVSKQDHSPQEPAPTAIYNAGRMAVAISHLLTSGMRLLGRKNIAFTIVATEDAARAWLDEQRRKLLVQRAASSSLTNAPLA